MLLNGASDVQSGWGGKLQPSHPISSLNSEHHPEKESNAKM